MVLSSVMIQLLYSIKMFLTKMVETRRRKKFIEFVAFLKKYNNKWYPVEKNVDGVSWKNNGKLDLSFKILCSQVKEGKTSIDNQVTKVYYDVAPSDRVEVGDDNRRSIFVMEHAKKIKRVLCNVRVVEN